MPKGRKCLIFFTKLGGKSEKFGVFGGEGLCSLRKGRGAEWRYSFDLPNVVNVFLVFFGDTILRPHVKRTLG
jgi:hypothetical protein